MNFTEVLHKPILQILKETRQLLQQGEKKNGIVAVAVVCERFAVKPLHATVQGCRRRSTGPRWSFAKCASLISIH
jgi:hypothetical protein